MPYVCFSLSLGLREPCRCHLAQWQIADYEWHLFFVSSAPSSILPYLRPPHRQWFSQFSSVVQSCLTLCDPMNRSTPGLPVHHQLPESTQTHGHWVGDAIQSSHPLLSPSPPACNLSQHQGLFQWVSSLHQVAKVLEFQLYLPLRHTYPDGKYHLY